jgi:hypothetical protein
MHPKYKQQNSRASCCLAHFPAQALRTSRVGIHWRWDMHCTAFTTTKAHLQVQLQTVSPATYNRYRAHSTAAIAATCFNLYRLSWRSHIEDISFSMKRRTDMFTVFLTRRNPDTVYGNRRYERATGTWVPCKIAHFWGTLVHQISYVRRYHARPEGCWKPARWA